MVETTINDREYYERLARGPDRKTKLKKYKFLMKYGSKLTKNELDNLGHLRLKKVTFIVYQNT